jgi:hypothetical protein
MGRLESRCARYFPVVADVLNVAERAPAGSIRVGADAAAWHALEYAP